MAGPGVVGCRGLGRRRAGGLSEGGGQQHEGAVGAPLDQAARLQPTDGGGQGPGVEAAGGGDARGIGGPEGEGGDDRQPVGLGQQAGQLARRRAQRVSSAFRSLVGVSLGEILGQASAILPSAPTRKAERTMPM